METIILTRKELYDLVWSKSITQLAKTYNVSTSFLRKKCVENNVPLPRNGYWSKLKFNKKVVIVELPDPVNYNQIIELNYLGKGKILRVEGNDENRQDEVLRSEELEKLKLNSSLLLVPKQLRNSVPKIKALHKALKDERPSEGWLFNWEERFDIKVSSDGLNRALRILNTLLVLFKELNWQVDTSFETKIVAEGEALPFSFREKRKRTHEIDKYGWSKAKYTPTGVFTITIGKYPSRVFSDGRMPLEQKLGAIVDYIANTARKEKQERLEREERRRKREEEELIKRKAKQRADEEFQNMIILRNRAFLWQEAQNIESYISSLESQPDLSHEQSDYITWAKRKVNWLNPLTDKTDEFLSEEYKIKFLEYLNKRN
jgi:hypothetical protein